MDQAKRGSDAISKGDFAAAITHYTEALKQMPQAVDYYIKRSTAYTRLSPPDHQKAFDDAETAVVLATKRAKRELIASAQLRRAIALFGLERYADARTCLAWVKKLNEKEKSLAIWEMKIAGKTKDLPVEDERLRSTILEVSEITVPTADGKPIEKKTPHQVSVSSTTTAPTTETRTQITQTPASKIRHDWTQRPDEVEVTLFAKAIPKEKVAVEIRPSSLSITFPLVGGADYDFSLDPLYATIDAESSSYEITNFKAIFKLKKAQSGQKWPSLEGKGLAKASDKGEAQDENIKQAVLVDKTNAVPSYPTSSKSGPKNWDKVASDLTQKPKKDGGTGTEEDDDFDGEGDPVNNFFKTLYKGADDDTRRAMMKSYQESNGTALSTNWAEVSKGKVETTPPDGMEAKPY